MSLRKVTPGTKQTKIRNRLQMRKGASCASASTMTLGTDGNFFVVTGTTATKYITTTDWEAGAVVILEFEGAVVVHDDEGTTPAGAADITLKSGGDFTTAAGDLLVLLYNGTVWKEVSRVVI
jgi:hypothetical protein